jgi:hypothetical protein
VLGRCCRTCHLMARFSRTREKRDTMADSVHEKWQNFLNPEVMRPTLITASLYITAFELLKDAIITRVCDFYTSKWDNGEAVPGPEYLSKVLSRSSSPVHASLAWLRENGAVEDTDLDVFKAVKDLRNKLVHRLPQVLNEGLPAALPEHFAKLVALLRKIEVWFVMEVEIPTNPDFDAKEVDSDDVQPGSVLSLQILLDVALGDEEKSRYYFDEFRKRSAQS